MTFDNFKKALDFLKRSGCMELRLGGGEPTIHPRLKDFIDLGLSSGFKVLLFTNGLFDEKIGRALYSRKRHINYLWNINHPSSYVQSDWTRLKNNLKQLAFNDNSNFGINIYKTTQDLSYLYDLCKEFRPHQLRYVFAHRMGNGSEVTIEPRHLHKIITRIAEFIPRIGELGITAHFDCGFIPCVWIDVLGVLVKYGASFRRCDLCPVVDTELNVSHCFCAYEHRERRSLRHFKELKDVYIFLKKVKDSYRDLYLFRRCKNCVSLKLDACDEGCLGDRKVMAGAV